jgi:ADP-ribose pyrophosphatase YjhB (NUDIX family)
VRETAEEVGMNVRLGAMLGLFSDPANPLAAVAVYLAEPGSETPGLSAEATEVRYFAPSEIPWNELAFPTTAASLKAWLMMIEPR